MCRSLFHSIAANTECNCSRRWVVTLKPPMKLGELYNYKNDTECTVLQLVLSEAFGEHTAVVDPDEKDLGPPIEYIICAGYCPCLMVFIGEIEFMVKELYKSHNYLFQGTYTTKVLHCFGDELECQPKNQVKMRFQSKVLNPILQRHLQGLTDYEAVCIKEAVGKTRHVLPEAGPPQ